MALPHSAVAQATHFYADTLALDFYSSPDWTPSDPVVVFLHGGGFSGGSRAATPVVQWAQSISAEGVAVASISYRLLQKGRGFGCEVTVADKRAAIGAAAENASQASDWLVLHGLADGAVYLGGSSAGAEAALENAYGLPGGSTTRSAPPWAGVISFAGALDADDLALLSSASPPLFAYHGLEDEVVPHGTDLHRKCGADDAGAFRLAGPSSIQAVLESVGVASEVHLVVEDGHAACNRALVAPEALFEATRFLKSGETKSSTQRLRWMDDRGFIVGVGDTAPEWSLEALDGTSYSNLNTLGKVVVLQFTASWCKVCRAEMPHLESEVQQAFGGREDFLLIGVDYDESPQRIEQFAEEVGVTYPLAPDPHGTCFHTFAGPKQGVTRNVVIGKDGRIVQLTRLFDADEFSTMIETIEELLRR